MRCFLLSIILVPHVVMAMHLSPMERELVIFPTGPMEEIKLHLQNLESESKSFSIEVLKRSEDENGIERRIKTSDLTLTVAPTASNSSSIGSGETRELILRYIGNRGISSEQAYRLIVTETTGTLRMKYISSIYVRPDQAKADLQAETRAQRLSADRIQVVLRNKGKAHQRLDDFVPELRFGETTVRLKPETLAAWDKENVLSGMKRVLQLGAEAPVPPDAKLVFSLVRSR